DYYRAVSADVSLVAISDRQRHLAPELNWIATVHNALNLDTWPFSEHKRDYALFLGRFHPEKAPHLALEAAHEIGLSLVLAGRCEGPEEQEYFDREIQPRLGRQDRVFGIADAEAKRALLVDARCLIFPVQWEEPFGMVMIESMACGTPVVALNNGAVSEVIIDGVTGIVCDEPHELGDALKRVTELDPAACRAHVAENFNAPGLATGYSAAYRTAMLRSAPGGPGQHGADR
ncbi:MAG: glycosyltransferase, partial [Longispora sp.]|nr:glycosyltransferase [Longispora sp. (in: high G+C Gram-positive bacteria)]